MMINSFKSKFYTLASLLVAVSSCQQQEIMLDGEGQLALSVKLNKEIQLTRSTENPTLEQSAAIRVYSDKGLIRRYQGIRNIPSVLALKSGPYRVSVLAGDSVPASFDKKYFKGLEPFEVTKGTLTQVEVPCKIANSVVTVSFEELDELFSSYEVKVLVGDSFLTFNKETLSKEGFFMLPTPTSSIDWVFEGVEKNGQPYVQKGEIQSPKPAYQYALTFRFTETDRPVGGAVVDVTVDETEILVEDNVVIYMPPKIQGAGFDISQPHYIEEGSAVATSLVVQTSSQLDSLVIQSPKFLELGFADEKVIFSEMTAEELAAIEALGLSYQHLYDEAGDRSKATITFTSALMAQITAELGSYQFDIFASDSKKKHKSTQWDLTVSDALAMTLPVNPSSVWYDRAILQGKLLVDTPLPLSFRYREVGAPEWMSVEAQRQDMDLHASVVGLKSGISYEYQVVAGELPTTEMGNFATETAAQLPNNSFEFWTKPGSAWLIHADGEEMFWDSGNHGSATLGKNVTNYDESIFNLGARSVVMRSQFVGLGIIGKFAAGNMFAGKYLKTDGTDGVLGFGRPFESRPTRVRGKFKYRSGAVDYTTLSQVPEGAADTAFFYVALGDWTPVTFEGTEVPVLIKTKESERQLFDPSDPAVIAYGEMDAGASTEGEGLHEFVINLDYRTLERKPTHIVVVASASKYGDYFTGSSSSVLWMDDIELIYE